MKVKTSELSGASLDWAVAKCEGWRIATHDLLCRSNPRDDGALEHIDMASYTPSTEWAEGGPIIARERIAVDGTAVLGQWMAVLYVADEEAWEMLGPTPLIAAMRCYVASKLGAEIEIPE
jgi:hypothetical protein